METIKCAALRMKEGNLFSLDRPARHHDIFRMMRTTHVPLPNESEQGFLTDTGRFVDRFEARKIAEAAGQLIASVIDDKGRAYQRPHDQLFSEDVW